MCVCVCSTRRVYEESCVSNQQVYQQQQHLSSKWNDKLDLECRDTGQWISLAIRCPLCQPRLSIKVKVLVLLSLLQMDLIIRRLVHACTKINPIHWCLSAVQNCSGGTSSVSFTANLGFLLNTAMNIADNKRYRHPKSQHLASLLPSAANRLDKRFKGERLPSRAHQTLNDHFHSWINNPCQMKRRDKGLSHLYGHFPVEGTNFHYSGWNAPKHRKPPFP